ncbi:hypothetical protein BDR06DRAFT_1014267 [Suillus hirtellus]|nr:hypothetical protein BDR06DRAFT_1014267 [Suillus hirtellus]
MRAHFSELRYRAHDWKARQFATAYFPAWNGKPEEVPGIIKKESVKVESALDIKMESGSTAPLQRTSFAKFKRPPFLTIFTSGSQPKNKRVDIDDPHLAIQRVSSLPSSSMTGKNRAIQIISPLTRTADKHTSTDSNAAIAPIERPSSLMIVESEDSYRSVINTRIDGTVKSNASPTDSNTTHSVPEVTPTSPLSSVSFHSLLENLASSLKTPVT